MEPLALLECEVFLLYIYPSCSPPFGVPVLRLQPKAVMCKEKARHPCVREAP